MTNISPEEEGSSPEFIANAKKLRACSNCARLKIRCRWPPATEHGEPTDCTRCSRMNIRCRVPEPVPRKKRGKSRQSTSSRVTELEKKIDGLVNLFQTQQHAKQHEAQDLTPATSTSNYEENALRGILPCAGLSLPQPATEASSNAATPDPQRSAQQTPDAGPLNTLQLVPGLSITMDEAEEYLNIYRTRMVPHFPFVPIHVNVTARDLHSEKRFLFWCIMQALIPQTAPVQKAVDDWIRHHVAIHLIVNRERRLELLQGLLIYIAKGDIHIHIGMSANGLLQLAIGMVTDMSINTLAGPLAWMPKTMLSDAWAVISKGKHLETPKQTLEEQRAILGGYFLASSVAISMRRAPQVPWSAYMARCCRAIREAREFATDPSLLAFVQIQHITDRLRSLFPIYDRDEDSPIPFFKEHYSSIFSSVRKEIEDLPKQEPAITKDNPLVWCLYVTLPVRLYEPALGMRPMSPAEAASPTEPYSRTDALWKCLESVQTAMVALTSIPAETYAYLPFTLVSSTAFVMMAGNRLLLEDGSPDWDVTIARQKIPHAENAQRMADKFEEADNVALIVGQKRRLFEDQTSRWANYAYRARWMKNWYLSKVSPPQREPSAEQPPNTAEGSTNDPSMSWVDDVTMDKMFWGQMIVDGFGQMPYDFQFGNDSMQTLQGIMWQDGMSTTETMAMANMIPQ
ncbi:C6 transcription factor [Colletotrichum kahawae]|uniref:C6 transcription factor n=1 Tax=Colletotrichum kahawae TaxID=34407 RepID=A0AAD9YC46_COLKA|nr:C6 transcription factor [Colletotrichum kahawae]